MRVWVDASTLIALESNGEVLVLRDLLGQIAIPPPIADEVFTGRESQPCGRPGGRGSRASIPGRPEAVDVPRLGDWRGILVREAERRPPHPRRDPGRDRCRGRRSRVHRPPWPPVRRGRDRRDPRLPRAGDPGEAGPEFVPDELGLVRGGPPPAGGPGLSFFGRYPGRPQLDVWARIVTRALCVPGRRDQARSAGRTNRFARAHRTLGR